MMSPFMNQVTVEAGLDESVVQVSLSMFTPSATTLALPVMFVKRGATETQFELMCAYCHNKLT